MFCVCAHVNAAAPGLREEGPVLRVNHRGRSQLCLDTMCGESQCFPFILAAALVRSGLLKVTALRLWPLGGSNLRGDSLVDSLFEEVPLVSHTDELSVVALASLDAALTVCRLPAREPRLSQDKQPARYNLTVPLKGHSAGRLGAKELFL